MVVIDDCEFDIRALLRHDDCMWHADMASTYNGDMLYVCHLQKAPSSRAGLLDTSTIIISLLLYIFCYLATLECSGRTYAVSLRA